jgi:hypothetical protein
MRSILVPLIATKHLQPLHAHRFCAADVQALPHTLQHNQASGPMRRQHIASIW